MKCLMFFAVLFCGFLLSAWTQTSSPPAPRTLVLYDNFNGPRIDPARWESTAEVWRMKEIVRELSPAYQGEGNNRRLHLSTRSYSWTGSDQDVSWGWLGFTFSNPAPITEISFDVVANSASMSNCLSNSATASVGAQFRGRFFNNGNGDLGDVETVISLERSGTEDAKAPLSANAYYYSQDGTVSNYRLLGSVPLGQTARLHLKWNQADHEFIFQLNNGPFVHMAYNSVDIFPARTPYKGLQVTPGTPNCTTTPLGSAVMDAYFDNVYVNSF